MDNSFYSAFCNITVAELNLHEAQDLLDQGFITLEEFLKTKKNHETSEIQMIKSKCEYTVNYYKYQKAQGSLFDIFDIDSTLILQQ